MYISYFSAKKEDFSASSPVMDSTNSKANKAICKAQQQARFSLSQLQKTGQQAGIVKWNDKNPCF